MNRHGSPLQGSFLKVFYFWEGYHNPLKKNRPLKKDLQQKTFKLFLFKTTIEIGRVDLSYPLLLMAPRGLQGVWPLVINKIFKLHIIRRLHSDFSEGLGPLGDQTN